jgi:hypothetical protein
MRHDEPVRSYQGSRVLGELRLLKKILNNFLKKEGDEFKCDSDPILKKCFISGFVKSSGSISGVNLNPTVNL